MNQREIGQLLINSSDLFKDPIYIENDYSAFDSHVCVDWLKLYHHFVLKHYSGNDKRYLKYLLKFDYNHFGYTTRNNIFKIRGTLTSGMIDTSMKGNFINYTIISILLQNIPPFAYKFICNGDDSVLIMSKKYYDPKLFQFEQFGMEAKMIVKTNIFDVDFCQSKLINTPLGFTMFRDPERIFTRLGIAFKNFSPKKAKVYLRSLLLCEMAVNYQVPKVYKTLYNMYKKLGRGNTMILSTYLQEVYESNRPDVFMKPFDNDIPNEFDDIDFLHQPSQSIEDHKQDVLLYELTHMAH